MADNDSSGPPSGSIPLHEAMKQFLPAEMWKEHARATEARKHEPRPVSWFDSSGRDWETAQKVQRRPSARADLHRVWYGMLAAMKAKLEAGELRAFGQEDPPFGPWRQIPAPAWRQLRINNATKGQAMVHSTVIHDIHILPPDIDDLIPPGTPGRPGKGIDIIEIEFQRRIESGEIEPSLAAESRLLADWYHRTYPRRDPPTAKTVENRIRLKYKEAKSKLP